jgi:hypothetical protein
VVAREVWSRQLLLEEGQLLLPPGLLETGGAKYSLVFQPSGAALPQGDEVGVISAELALLSLEGPGQHQQLDEITSSAGGGGDWGAFVSEVGLVASVDWAGAIRVEWRLARAAGTTAGEPSYRLADGYRLTLRIGEGRWTIQSLRN